MNSRTRTHIALGLSYGGIVALSVLCVLSVLRGGMWWIGGLVAIVGYAYLISHTIFPEEPR